MKHAQKVMSLVLVLAASALFMGSRWARTYGGSETEFPYSIDKTSDGGFVIAGQTVTTPSNGYRDIEITKIDGRGAVQWHRLIGGPYDEGATGIRQMPDGGYIVLGYTGAFSPGFSDLYLCKLSSTGEMVWQKTYGGAYGDDGDSLELTPDGGFIVVGGGASFPRASDYWVIKFNANGDPQWQKLYGGSNTDGAYQIKRTADGGYIIVGISYSFTSGSNSSIWVVKLSINGDIQWQRTYLAGEIFARGIAQTPDGGYVVLAEGDVGSGGGDAIVLKLNSNGDIAWGRFYGGTSVESPSSIIVTSDGGILFSATTWSFGHGAYDLWLVKLSSSGAILWQRTYGGTKNDGSAGTDTLLEAPGGSLLVGGYTDNWGAGKSDMWILRLFSDGTLDDGNPIVGTSAATIWYYTGQGTATAATALTPTVATGSPGFTSRTVAIASTLVTEVLLSPPAGVTLQRAINRNLFRKEAFHTITWSADPRNAKFVLAGYNLYRKLDGAPDSSYVLLAELPSTTLSYEDKYLDVTKTYVYMLQAEDVEGYISAASTTVKNSTLVR